MGSSHTRRHLQKMTNPGQIGFVHSAYTVLVHYRNIIRRDIINTVPPDDVDESYIQVSDFYASFESNNEEYNVKYLILL